MTATPEESKADDTPQSAPAPPVSELEDVPPEEWAYWNAQALWGCAVIGALILALFLPLLLLPSMGEAQARLTGFGVGGALSLLSIFMILRITNQKRRERRAALRLMLETRDATHDTSTDDAR